MKSPRIIYLLFLIFCAVGNAKNRSDTAPDPESFYRINQIDSLYSIFSQEHINTEQARTVISWYQNKIDNNEELSKEDLKRIAISYAYLNNAPKAGHYLEKYIKSSYDISILDDSALKTIRDSNEYQALTRTYKFEIDMWILFFMASGVIGLFIAVVINLRKKGDIISNLLIGLFVLFNALFILHLSVYLSNYSFKLPHSFWGTVSFSFLYGPLLYFYFKRISEKYTFKWIDTLHLIPTLILVVYLIPLYTLPEEVKLHKLFNVDQEHITAVNVIITIKALSLLAYSFMVYRIYNKNNKSNTKTDVQVLKWQKNMTFLNITYALTYTVYAIILGTTVLLSRNNNIMLYSQVILIACIVLYVGYTAYVQPKVFSRKYLFAGELLKYQKSGLTEGFSNDLKEQLLVLFHQEKVYKINNINLDTLSLKLNTTRHNLSQVINEHFDLNFFNLINKYRIQEAIEILKNDSNNNLNIIDIAYDVGFNNKVTFNKAFKEETLLTPTQYLQSLDRGGFITSA